MTDESIDVTPRRKPVQARSRERVDAILRHAAAIFHENGVDGTSMSAIARQSDMSLASLYRYFPNKAAIVHAIAEGHVEKMEDRKSTRLNSSHVRISYAVFCLKKKKKKKIMKTLTYKKSLH